MNKVLLRLADTMPRFALAKNEGELKTAVEWLHDALGAVWVAVDKLTTSISEITHTTNEMETVNSN